MRMNFPALLGSDGRGTGVRTKRIRWVIVLEIGEEIRKEVGGRNRAQVRIRAKVGEGGNQATE